MVFVPASANRRSGRVRRLVLLAGFASLLSAPTIPALAQTDDDLPTRVGRIAEASGDIFLAPEDRANEWIPVGLNYPVTSGDNLWVGGEGRAEIDYGGGQFRLGGDTNLNVSRLDERQLALFVAQGRLVVRVRAIGPGESVRVDAPNAQIQLMRPGLYRIDVPPDRAMTTVSVREGEAQIAWPGGIQQTLPGQSVVLVGAEPAYAELRNGLQRDAFDAWSSNRDRYYESGTAVEYVSPEMVGYAELDHYGSWENYPQYGNVWFPTGVAPGWAPYSDGYWTSVGGWGSTWVDAAPWGYAPSHYGRWVWFGQRWGWCPGRVSARPAWAPALVGWYGGAGWGAALGTPGSVYGWVPLGWREPFEPWWRRCTERCWTRYNRPYSVAVPYAQRHAGPPPTHVNANVPGALERDGRRDVRRAQAGRTEPDRSAARRDGIRSAADRSAAGAAESRRRTSRRRARSPARCHRRRPRFVPRRPGRASTTPTSGALPARAQTPALAQPTESRARTPAVVTTPPAATPSAPSGNAAPANPGRAATIPVPGQPPPRDAATSANVPAVKADGRTMGRTEPVRTVPVPQTTPPASNAGIPMPPSRSEPVRAVPGAASDAARVERRHPDAADAIRAGAGDAQSRRGTTAGRRGSASARASPRSDRGAAGTRRGQAGAGTASEGREGNAGPRRHERHSGRAAMNGSVKQNAGNPRRFARRDGVALFRDQRESLPAVDELHALVLVDRRLARVRERADVAGVHLDRHRPVSGGVLLLLDLVADVGAAGRARDRRDGVAAPAADLVADHTADDAARDHSEAAALALLLDVLDGLDDAAVVAAVRLCNRVGGSAAERQRGGQGEHASAGIWSCRSSVNG